jgi:hypothetical protein
MMGFSIQLGGNGSNSERAISKTFYTISALAHGWNCSRATVYSILREAEFKLLSVGEGDSKRGKWNIPAAVVEHIEKVRGM